MHAKASEEADRVDQPARVRQHSNPNKHDLTFDVSSPNVSIRCVRRRPRNADHATEPFPTPNGVCSTIQHARWYIEAPPGVKGRNDPARLISHVTAITKDRVLSDPFGEISVREPSDRLLACVRWCCYGQVYHVPRLLVSCSRCSTKVLLSTFVELRDRATRDHLTPAISWRESARYDDLCSSNSTFNCIVSLLACCSFSWR